MSDIQRKEDIQNRIADIIPEGIQIEQLNLDSFLYNEPDSSNAHSNCVLSIDLNIQDSTYKELKKCFIFNYFSIFYKRKPIGMKSIIQLSIFYTWKKNPYTIFGNIKKPIIKELLEIINCMLLK